MDDDVRQSSQERYALSQAYRWRAERDQARQELEVIQARLMPEGMEWPRFEDSKPVAFRDKGLDVHGHARSVEGVKFTQGGFVFISDDMGKTWWANDRGPMEDPEIDPDKRVKLRLDDGAFTGLDPDQLTHTKSEIDSWERIEEDVMVDAKDYCESRGISSEYPKHSGKAKCEDIVRRCRALAGRERGE